MLVDTSQPSGVCSSGEGPNPEPPGSGVKGTGAAGPQGEVKLAQLEASQLTEFELWWAEKSVLLSP